MVIINATILLILAQLEQNRTSGSVVHLTICIAKSFPLVHTHGTCTSTKAIAFRSKLPAMTLSAIQLLFMLRYICGFQKFVAHFTFEAGFVELETTGQFFLCSIDRLCALWAFHLSDGLERHLERVHVLSSVKVS